MCFILKGMRYQAPIQEECEDVDMAIATAMSWLPSQTSSLQDPDYCSIGWAHPLHIEDSEGNIVVNEEELKERIYW